MEIRFVETRMRREIHDNESAEAADRLEAIRIIDEFGGREWYA